MTSPADQIIRLGFGFAISQALHVVIDLSIADRLAGGELGIADLARQTGSEAGALYRIMRLLAAEGVFRETSAQRFVLTDVGATLCSSEPHSPSDLIRMLNQESYLAFARLSDSVRTGKPAFDDVFGQPRFDWLAEHPEQAAIFQRAMISLSQGANEAVAEAYDFAGFSSVVDVGGGHGQLLAAILSRHPHLAGLLFDLPTAIAATQSCKGGRPPHASYVAGSFFDFVPAGADVYILKKVIHDWSDAEAIQILRNCREALKPGGRVLIAETIVPAGNEIEPIKFIDVQMLVVTGGVERTAGQYSDLLEQAGLRLNRIIGTLRSISILEATACSDTH
jgi:SAM-dependent methyltransferase